MEKDFRNYVKSFDWSMLPKGVYTISFNINNQKTFEKMVLQ